MMKGMVPEVALKDSTEAQPDHIKRIIEFNQSYQIQNASGTYKEILTDLDCMLINYYLQ